MQYCDKWAPEKEAVIGSKVCVVPELLEAFCSAEDVTLLLQWFNSDIIDEATYTNGPLASRAYLVHFSCRSETSI